MPTQLEQDFHAAMVNIYKLAKTEAGYNAARYIQMVSENGGLETAKMLINADTPSDGYTELWKRGRLDLTVEALVTNNPKWSALFEDVEIKRAMGRLHAYEYQSIIKTNNP